jgi:PAS domain S-box-containing protein
MAIGRAEFAAVIEKALSVKMQLKRFLSRYFYLCMSLVRSLNARSIVLFVAGYYLSVRLSEHAYGSLGVSSPFWLPGAFLLFSFLLIQKKHWPLIAVAVFPIRVAAGAPLGTPLWFLLFSSADDLVTTLFAAWLLCRVLRRPVRLATLNEFLLYLAIAAGIGPALAALIAAPGRHALGDSVAGAAYRWYLGNALGQAIVTPTLLYWYMARRARSYPHFKELLVLSGGLTAVSLYTFVFSGGPYSPILSYAPVPFIVWAALRLRPAGTATAVSLLASVAMLSAAEGVGLFSKGSPSQNTLSLQLFLLVVSIPLLSLSIIIDERQRANQTLRESEERFRLVSNTAPVLIWMSGTEKLRNYFNQPWLDFTGRTLETELSEGWTEGVHRDDVAACLKTYSEAFEKRDSFQTQYRLRRHDGEFRWISDIGVPRYNPDRSFAGYIGSCVDITERKLAEEALTTMGRRLIEAHEEERAWIGRELHDDINQRLALLAVELDRLNKRHHPSTDFSDGVRRARGQVADIAKDVQALSHRLHSSKLEYLGLVSAANGFCKELSDQHNVQIDFSHTGVPRNLSKEISLCLFRVLQESLQNAVKHSGVRDFKLELFGTPREIQLIVKDLGVGFDQQDTMNRHGLGLISMRERLQLVGGEFSVKSEPGHGTTICACVPLREEHISSAAAG